ncbi:MAG TPA: hypothetical protein VFV33_12095, partial [Gemmatimonadaceae bacterium]|nr:hypothetical protein [Gemmatimonadaceae bacterium]
AVLDALRDEWYVQRFGWDAHGAVAAQSPPMRLGREGILAAAASHRAQVVGGGAGAFPGGRETLPEARHVVGLAPGTLLHAVDLAAWEPEYGRLAEAQVKWEQAHGRALGLAG